MLKNCVDTAIVYLNAIELFKDTDPMIIVGLGYYHATHSADTQFHYATAIASCDVHCPESSDS